MTDRSRSKCLLSLVARGGIEPPTRGFSVRRTPPVALSFNELPARPLRKLPNNARLCGTDSRKTPAIRGRGRVVLHTAGITTCRRNYVHHVSRPTAPCLIPEMGKGEYAWLVQRNASYPDFVFRQDGHIQDDVGIRHLGHSAPAGAFL
jgi:hypothetical protein